MIHVINTLRANLIHREVSATVEVILAKNFCGWDGERIAATTNRFWIGNMQRRLERLRARRWAPWKDKH